MDDFQSGMLDRLERRPEEIGEAVAAWALEVQPELVSSTSLVTADTPPLPAVLVEVRAFAGAPANDDRFPGLQIQEIGAVVYDVQLLLGVKNGEPGTTDEEALEQEKAAAAFLTRTAARLRGSAWYDATLGGRVLQVSRQIGAEFGDLFVEYGDGVRARAAAMTMAVADVDTEGSWA